MKTIVAFTGNGVSVLCGDGNKDKITINKIIQVGFEDNCVINGIITDKDIFCDGIKRAWAENKLPKTGVLLSVDGNNIKTKRITVPKLNKKKTNEIVSYEFRDSGVERQETVSGYIPVESAGADMAALALSAEKDYIMSLAEIFLTAGIKLGGITASRCGVVYALPYIDEVKDKNCIILSLDGDNISSILVEQGKYVSFSTTRLFSDHGTASFGTEVGRTVSQMLQFQSTMRSENMVTDVYFLGFSSADYNASSSPVGALSLKPAVISGTSRIEVAGGSIADCFNHAGVFAMDKNLGNLYLELINKGDKAKKRDEFLKKLLPVLAIIALFSVISSILITSNISKEKKVNELNEYLSNTANIEKQAEYNDYVEKSAALNAKYNAAESTKKAIESYPYAVSSLNDIISSCGQGIVDVTINSYDSASGLLNFTPTGSNAETLNEFIKALTDTGLFYNVTYSGYALSDTESTYNVNVSCTLSSQAGK